jgi:hypothetical protein
MDIKQFVKDSLIQIAGAIKDANTELAELGSQANPPGATSQSEAGTTYVDVIDTQNIEFDLAVTITETATTSGGGSISVWSVGIGGEKSSEGSKSSVSRIKFTVPLKLPR